MLCSLFALGSPTLLPNRMIMARLSFPRSWWILVVFCLWRQRNSSSWASEDPCKDRPFKEWFAELRHLAKTMDNVIRPFYKDYFAMPREQWELYGTDEVIKRVNPCGFHLKSMYKSQPNPGRCGKLLFSAPKCTPDDRECVEIFMDIMIRGTDCVCTMAAHVLDGRPNLDYHSHFVLNPFSRDVYGVQFRWLKDVECAVTTEKKDIFFQGIQRATKLLALGHIFPYPVTLSGAMCETTPLRVNKKVADELVMAGAIISDKVRQFYALPQEQREECAADEVMWEVDDCAVEIKKFYRTREDSGDCSAHFTAATGRCYRGLSGLFDFEDCEAALEDMQNGFECYTTRLARDSATGFTSYADDDIGGFVTFEEELELCVEGGWLHDLERIRGAGRNVRSSIQKVHTLFKRLEQLVAFGCDVVCGKQHQSS